MTTDTNVDLYKVLCLSREATQDDIKRAYKRLALQHHPDKKAGDDKEFKKINEAYQILSDPEKRKIYDLKYEDNINVDLLTKFASILMDIVREKLKEKVAAQQKTQTQSQQQTNGCSPSSPSSPKSPDKPKPIILKMSVDMEDIYHAKVKKIVVKVKRKTDDGMLFKSVPLYISLLNIENEYVFKGQGDDSEDGQECNRSDIIVKIDIGSACIPNVTMDTLFCKYDLHMEYKMSLFEYLYGIDAKLSYFDDETIHIRVEPSARDFVDDGYYNYVHEVIDKGLPYINASSEDNNVKDEVQRGKLYIYCKLYIDKVPRDILLEHKNIFKTYFNKNGEEFEDCGDCEDGK